MFVRRTALVTLLTLTAAWSAAVPAVRAACWVPPVAAPISDPFRPPACRWCPGNRGIEYDTRPGQHVTAVESGRVRFAGTVAGRIYVVVEHRDGRRVTYGGLADRRHDTGAVVLRGQLVGTAGDAVHFGVRVGDRYVDPATSIGRLVGRPRLVPSDGRPAAPAPPPRLRCDGHAATGGGANRTSGR